MSWQCPYCDHSQVVTFQNHYSKELILDVSEENPELKRGIQLIAIRCLNKKCGNLSLTLDIHKVRLMSGADRIGEMIESRHILPSSTAKALPEYIPAKLREDYSEACAVLDLSPKASATLARRCLQGMIRDFCGIRENTLYKEIDSLVKRVAEGNAPRFVDEDTVATFETVRKIGNVGAHMESTTSEIVDVEPEEARILLKLIETLFDEWYIAREKRRQRLESVREVSSAFENRRNMD
jgi:hypothetical protein